MAYSRNRAERMPRQSQAPTHIEASKFRLLDTFAEAFAAIGQRPIRTLLTALGTILGVGAFVTTTGLAETARAQVSSRFDALRATEVRVQDATPDGSNPFPDDVDGLLQALSGVNHAGLTFTVSDNGTIQARNTATRQTPYLSLPQPRARLRHLSPRCPPAGSTTTGTRHAPNT